MKKIFLSFLIFLSLSYAKDLDILSIASNGSLSDKTSHKLNTGCGRYSSLYRWSCKI